MSKMPKVKLVFNTKNKNITDIINKFEEDIEVLKSEIMRYEFVKFKYNMYQYYSELQSNYFSKSHDCETYTDTVEDYQRVIKYLAGLCIEIHSSISEDFCKIKEIIRKEEILETIKKLGNSKHIDDIMEVIKNLS